MVRVVEEMKKAEVKVLWGDKWQIEGRRFGVERGKSICTKEHRVKSENNPVAS